MGSVPVNVALRQDESVKCLMCGQQYERDVFALLTNNQAEGICTPCNSRVSLSRLLHSQHMIAVPELNIYQKRRMFPVWLRVLAWLQEQGGVSAYIRLDPGLLAREIGCQRSYLYRVVKDMVRRGMLETQGKYARGYRLALRK